jgi:hypothetical protein
VLSGRSGEKFTLALQAMQTVRRVIKDYSRQKAEIERLKDDKNRLEKMMDNLCKELDAEKNKNF